jgi:hypothetical protein
MCWRGVKMKCESDITGRGGHCLRCRDHRRAACYRVLLDPAGGISSRDIRARKSAARLDAHNGTNVHTRRPAPIGR